MAVGAFVALAANAAVVYKWVDSNGVTHYSDQPAPGSQKIVTTAPNTSDPTVPYMKPPPAPSNGPGPVHYERVTIIAPTDGQTFFPDQSVSATVQTEPAIAPGARVVWRINGKELTEWGPNATGGTLSGLERGSYTLSCTVTDPASGETLTSPAVVFNIRLPSLLAPQRKH